MKKTQEFHDNEIEIISGESELLCRCGTIYNVQSILMSLSPHQECGAYSMAALINFFVPDAELIRVNTVLWFFLIVTKYYDFKQIAPVPYFVAMVNSGVAKFLIFSDVTKQVHFHVVLVCTMSKLLFK